jgi:hypothetical protein
MVWTLATAQHQAISQGVENLSRELEAAREVVARTTSLTVDMTERERARLDALASLIDGTSVRLEALRSRLDSDTERSLSSVIQVQNSLASLAGIVVEKLR